MDQGLAALLGAAVGMVGTMAAAAVSGRATRWTAQLQALTSRWATQAQAAYTHAQWRREVRRDAYARVLEAGHAALEACDRYGSKYLLQAAGVEPEVGAREPIEVAERRLMLALEAVRLEGPRVMEEEASAIRSAFHGWHVDLMVGSKQAHEPPDGQEVSAEERRARWNAARDQFSEARKEYSAALNSFLRQGARALDSLTDDEENNVGPG